jgi:PKHD-type hydroxylase
VASRNSPTRPSADPAGEFRVAVQIPDVFRDADCDRLIALADELGQSAGAIAREDGSGDTLDTSVRRVRQTPVPRDAHAWAYERLTHALDACNREHFGFDLEDYDGDALVVDYRVGDFYQWHLDVGREASTRKLSVSVCLSAPEDYEGGTLAFPGLEFDDMRRGSAVVFPSFVLHGVQPVKRGRRCALVAWVAGPPFR